MTWLAVNSLRRTLGINTLVITDLDAKKADGSNAVPKRGQALLTRNQTIKTWLPAQESLDLLLDMKSDSLALLDPSGVGIRVAYQQPTNVSFGTDKDGEAIANTFEDALVYHNTKFFRELEGTGLAKKFRDALNTAANLEELAGKLHADLAKGDKAELAMNLLESENLEELVLPAYIDDGLKWLIAQLKRKEDDVAGKLQVKPNLAAGADAAELAEENR